MDMLNRFKSTVGSAYGTAVGAVMGNPVMREYEVTRHVGSGGPACLWKIYHGIKHTTKQVGIIVIVVKSC